MPAWIAAEREARDLSAARDALFDRVRRAAARRAPSAYAIQRDRRELGKLVEVANRAILRLDLEAPTARQQRRPLSLEAELAALDAAHGGREPRNGG